MLKEPYTYKKRYFVGKIHGYFFATLLLLRYYMSLLAIARQLWRMNQE
jgi:hypothetical protein